MFVSYFFQADDGIRDTSVTGVQTCALPIYILFSRVARSNIFGLVKLGARVTLVGPSTLVPHEFEKLGVEVSHTIDDVLPNADVVNLLRIQHERQRKEYFPGIGEYTRFFGLTKERAKLLK